MEILIKIAMVLGITFSTGPEQVPTCLCYDPLLGPTVIIYSDCGGAQGEIIKELSSREEQPIEQLSQQQPEQGIVPTSSQPAEQLSVLSAQQPKAKCNKGSGNGAEGCDPGNHPEKGNNDEGGDRQPQNSKKNNEP